MRSTHIGPLSNSPIVTPKWQPTSLANYVWRQVRHFQGWQGKDLARSTLPYRVPSTQDHADNRRIGLWIVVGTSMGSGYRDVRTLLVNKMANCIAETIARWTNYFCISIIKYRKYIYFFLMLKVTKVLSSMELCKENRI